MDQQIYDLHSQLMTYIKGHLEPEKFEELKAVVEARKKITRHEFATCDTFEKLWRNLFLKQCIKYGDYKLLKDVLKQIGMESVNKLIRRTEDKISEIRSFLPEHRLYGKDHRCNQLPAKGLHRVVGRSEVQTVRKQNERKELQKKRVQINGVQYRLDVPMAADSPIVKYYVDQYHLNEFINKTKDVMAAVRQAKKSTFESKDTELSNRMKDICSSTKKICINTRRLYDERICPHVIEAFQRVILHIIDNDRKYALKSLDTVGEFVNQSCEDTRELIKDINKTLQRMEAFNTEKAKVEDVIKEKLEGYKKEIDQSEKERSSEEEEKTRLDEAIGDNCRREGKRIEKAARVEKNSSVASKVTATGVVGSGIALFGGIAAALKAGTVATTVCVAGSMIVAPIFLLVGIGGGIVYIASEIQAKEIKKEGQKNFLRIQSQTTEYKNTGQKQSKIDARLAELTSLSINPAKNSCSCFQDVKGHIECVKKGLQALLGSWEGLKVVYKDIQNQTRKFQRALEEDGCSKILKTDDYRCKVVHFYARLVSMKEFARRWTIEQ